MHEWGDSGITAILFAIVVAVVLSFGVAQQARARAARYQEIRRLQSVAAEEARREEAAADAEYTSMVATRNRCAVCLNPTTTRCARCKAVHYCSGQCQAQHWNRGHKQECRAPVASSPGSSSNGSRGFSDVISSNGSSSRTLSGVSDVQRVEDAAPAELARAPLSWAGNGTLDKPQKVLFPYDYFVKFFNWERLKVPPCGLINCGNSCFANVVLQCLTHTRPLTAYLLEGSHGEECKRSDWCFMCELQDLVWRVRQNRNPFSPIRILSRIRNIGNHLGYGRQEDAHEFMRFAIDSMQSICLDEAGGEKSVDPRSQETTLIHHIFGGHLQSQVKCMQCLHESNRYENMMDLAVEIHGCVETLEDALTQFTAPELLDGENKYKCDRCNAYVKARKRLTVHEAPNILTIALKRFQSGNFGKLNKRVTFPEVLDMASFMSGKGDRPPVYRLYAVVVHVDMLNASFFGHYICYVKDSQGLWYKIDDSKVKEVDLEKVMSQRAYMLFYARSSARPAPVTKGDIPPYVVGGKSELGNSGLELCGDLQGFPAPLHPESDEMISVGGSEALHAMVDFRQMQGDYDRNPRTNYQELPFANGEIGAHQSSTWEIGQIVSTSNDREISVDDSGSVSGSSSLSWVSPCISNYRSNHVLWSPSQGVVSQVPDPSTVAETEYVAWDQKSSLPFDFSEVSLQVCVGDKPCTAKVGKRRLEDGLCPLPTPKPLDTDQLPAWPSGNHGRSVSCPLLLHVPPNQTNSSVLIESYSPRQNYDLEKTGELPISPTFPVQHRIAGDHMCFPAKGNTNLELERSDYIQVENTSVGEVVARAKRQHVEADSTGDPQTTVTRVDAQSTLPSSLNEFGGRDMDLEESSQQPGSLPVDPILVPVFNSGSESLHSDPGKGSHFGLQPLSPLLAQIRVEQQVSLRSPQDLELDLVPSVVTSLSSPGVVPEVEICKNSILEDSRAMLQLSASSIMLSGGGKGLSPPSDGGVDMNTSIPETGQKGNEEHHDDSSNVFPTKSSEISDRHLRVAGLGAASSSRDDVPFRESELENVFVYHESKKKASKEFDSVLANSATTGRTPDPLSNGSAQGLETKSELPDKLKKSKPVSKPLFAPGFLNRVRTPVSSNSKVKAGISATQNAVADMVANGPLIADVVANGPLIADGVANGPLIADGVANGPLIANADDLGSSCESCMNCDSFTVAKLPDVDELDNCNTMGKNLEKIGTEGDDEFLPKVEDEIGQHSGNDIESTLSTPPSGVDEEQLMEPVDETSATLGQQTSLGQLAIGKQKQGRNETCKCGSQRKWKKCCGKSGVMKPEPGRRRLVV